MDLKKARRVRAFFCPKIAICFTSVLRLCPDLFLQFQGAPQYKTHDHDV